MTKAVNPAFCLVDGAEAVAPVLRDVYLQQKSWMVDRLVENRWRDEEGVRRSLQRRQRVFVLVGAAAVLLCLRKL